MLTPGIAATKFQHELALPSNPRRRSRWRRVPINRKGNQRGSLRLAADSLRLVRHVWSPHPIGGCRHGSYWTAPALRRKAGVGRNGAVPGSEGHLGRGTRGFLLAIGNLLAGQGGPEARIRVSG